MCGCVVRIQLYCASELILGCLPIPVVVELNSCEGAVCFGEVAVELERLLGVSSRFWKDLVGGEIPVASHEGVAIRQSRVSWRITRFLPNGFFKMLDRFL